MKNDKIFFFACPSCYAKLVGSRTEINEQRPCTVCKTQLRVPAPPTQIPPLATIERVVSATLMARMKIILRCPYCDYRQSFPAHQRGARVNCQRCRITILIPAPPLHKMTTTLTRNNVVADGQQVVSIKALVTDRLGLPVAEQCVVFEILRSRGKSSCCQALTDAYGEALIGYTVGVYTATTTIKTYLRERPELSSQVTVHEIQGIADGRLQITQLYFPPQDDPQHLRAELEIENPGHHPVALQCLNIQAQVPKIADYQIYPWEQSWSDTILAPGKRQTIVVELAASTLPAVPETLELELQLELQGQNRVLQKQVRCQEKREVNISFRPRPRLVLRTVPAGAQTAGVPFALECEVLRDQERDCEYQGEMVLHCQATADPAPNGHSPQLLSPLVLQFQQGQARSEPVFCFYAAQSNVRIEVNSTSGWHAQIQLTVQPAAPAQCQLVCHSPQINTRPLQGTNYMRMLDEYGNLVRSFNQEVTLRLPNGELRDAQGRLVEHLPVVEGELDLTKAGLHLQLPADQVPCELSWQVSWQKLQPSVPLRLLPKPANLTIVAVQAPPEVEQGLTGCQVELQVENNGDVGFELDVLSCRFFQEDEQGHEQTRQSFYTIRPASRPGSCIEGHSQARLVMEIDIDPNAPIGRTGLQPSLGGRDVFDGTACSVSSRQPIYWQVHPQGRTFRVVTEHGGQEVAGVPFALRLEAWHQESLDPTYCGRKQLHWCYHQLPDTGDSSVKSQNALPPDVQLLPSCQASLPPASSALQTDQARKSSELQTDQARKSSELQTQQPHGSPQLQTAPPPQDSTELQGAGQRPDSIDLQNARQRPDYNELTAEPTSLPREDLSPSQVSSQLQGPGESPVEGAPQGSSDSQLAAKAQEYALLPTVSGARSPRKQQGSQDKTHFPMPAQHPPRIPTCLQLEFVQGVAQTPAVFVFFQPLQGILQVVDRALGGAYGELTQLQLAPGPLGRLELHLHSPQVNHAPWQGDNYLQLYDAYDNLKTDLAIPLHVSVDQGQLHLPDTGAFDTSHQASHGRIFLQPGWRLDLAATQWPVPVRLEVKAGSIQTTARIQIHPAPGVVQVLELHSSRRAVEQGEKGLLITALVNNSGESLLRLTNVELVGVCAAERVAGYELECDQLPMSLPPGESSSLSLQVTVPAQGPLGRLRLYLTLSFEDRFYRHSCSLSSLKHLSWQVEPADRELVLTANEQPVAGEAFELQVQVRRQGMPDPSYAGSRTLHCEIISAPSSQQPPALTPQAPAELKLVFNKGQARTGKHLRVFGTQQVQVQLADRGPGGAQGRIQLQPVPARLHAFAITLAAEHTASAPFRSALVIQAQDAYHNLKTDFQDAVTITASGPGKLQRTGRVPLIKPSEFQQGRACVAAEELCYHHPHQLDPLEVELILSCGQLRQSQMIKMLPPPATLEISQIKLAHSVVEWESGGYPVTLRLSNSGGSRAQLLDVKVFFLHQGQEVTQGYGQVAQQTYPHEIKGGEYYVLTTAVNLQSHLPLGQHTVGVSVKIRDTYYRTISEVRQVSSCSWQVEPTGRQIRVGGLNTPRAWQKWGLQLEVWLTGKLDHTYQGRHVLQCNSVAAPATPEHLQPPQVPTKITLDFHQGRAQSPPLWLFLQPGTVKLHLLENKIGGAQGEITVNIAPESWPHRVKRQSRQVYSWVSYHRQHLGIAASILLLLVLCCWHWLRVNATKQLEVIELRGEVTLGGRPLKLGQMIRAGVDIRVKGQGLCVLRMMNGSLIKLYGASHIYTNTLGRGLLSSTYAPELDIRAGDVVYQIKRNADEQPHIKIPHADHLEIHSHHFRLGVLPQKALTSVYQGQVAISSAGVTVAVDQGKGSTVRKGQAPTKPVPLPPAPVWLAPPDQATVTTNAVVMRWRAVPQSAHYIVEVCRAHNFPQPLLTEMSQPPSLKLRGLANGTFKCQVSSINITGFASAPSRALLFHHQAAFPARELIIKVQAQGRPVTPDSILVNGHPFNNGDELPFKEHQLVVRKAGYHPYHAKVQVNQGDLPLRLTVCLQPKMRLLKWQFCPENFANLPCHPMKIRWRGQPCHTLPTRVLPGKYRLVCQVPGFQPIDQQVCIPAGEGVYSVKLPLHLLPRRLQLAIRPSYPLSPFQPEVRFNGHLAGRFIKPGKYRLSITHPGFESYQSNLLIPPASEPLIIRHILMVKPRPVRIELTYDHPPAPQSPPAQLVLRMAQQRIQLSSSTTRALMPGKWQLQAWCPGYAKLTRQVQITPGAAPLRLRVVLLAQPVKLQPQFRFDVPLPPAHPAPVITLQPCTGGPAQRLQPDQNVLPGRYHLEIRVPGYQPVRQLLQLFPRTTPYQPSIMLRAQKRALAVVVKDPQRHITDRIIAVFEQQQRLAPPWQLQPGQPHQLTIWLQEHEPIKQTLNLPPGESPYQLSASLEDYPVFMFKIKRSSLQIDGMVYDLQFTADQRPVPASRVTLHELGRTIYCEIRISKQTRHLRMQLGFYYGAQSLTGLEQISLTDIDWPSLRHHLEALPPAQQLRRLQAVFQQDYDKVRRLSLNAQKALRHYLQVLQTKLVPAQQELLDELLTRLPSAG